MLNRVCIIFVFSLVACWAVYAAGEVQKYRKYGIIGGKPTNIKKHPYQVTVMTDCSGVILNKRWILTLASCIIPYDTQISNFSIRAGANSHIKGGKMYKLQEAVVHSMYNMTTRMYDFCLLKTEKPIKFNKQTKSIAYTTQPLKTGDKAIVSGWGQHEVNTSQTWGFRDIVMYGYDFSKCQQLYSGHVRDTMFCAMAKNSNNGPCVWDWSDPLVTRNKLYGIFAGWLINCPSLQYPSVFNDVSSVSGWIKKTISS